MKSKPLVEVDMAESLDFQADLAYKFSTHSGNFLRIESRDNKGVYFLEDLSHDYEASKITK
jgi:hypothetical protein